MKKLRLDPINIGDNTWYYEEGKGICIVKELKYPDGSHRETIQFYIPWKRLLESVRNKYGERHET